MTTSLADLREPQRYAVKAGNIADLDFEAQGYRMIAEALDGNVRPIA